MARTVYAAQDFSFERRMRSVRQAMQVIDQLRGRVPLTVLTKNCVTRRANPKYL